MRVTIHLNLKVVCLFICIGFLFPLYAGKLTSLAEKPDWSELDRFQKTMTREEFTRQLKEIYTPGREDWADLKINQESALIRKENGVDDWYEIQFCSNEDLEKGMNDGKDSREDRFPIIVLDPGHIGGDFAEMEFRHFQLEGYPAIREGELTLEIAKQVKQLLEPKGYVVKLTREKNEPVTTLRPKDLEGEALAWFGRIYGFNSVPDVEKLSLAQKTDVERRAKILFYRTAEILARTKVVDSVKPDLVVCLHINAEPWPNAEKPSLVNKNHMHFLVNGTYSEGELSYDDVRFLMIHRILSRFTNVEVNAVKDMVMSFSMTKPVAPFLYAGSYATNVDQNPFIWSRNLLANRLFNAPVIYLEPYVANSNEVIKWVMEGGENGKLEKSQFVLDYSKMVASGLTQYFERNKKLTRL